MINEPVLSSQIEVGESQFLVNGVLFNDLHDKVARSVAESAFELVFQAARYGVGEGTPAKGMLVVIGSSDDFKEIGYCDKEMNTFEGTQIDVRNWKAFKERILPSFVKDGALYIDGETGHIMADSFMIDMTIRFADQNGGTGYRNASFLGMIGCLAIKCPVDSCATDGKGKGKLKVFPGTRAPTTVPVPPMIPEVGPNQFKVNGVIIDLPNGGEIVNRLYAEATCELLLYFARNGIGERIFAKGMLIIVGSEEHYKNIGYYYEGGTNRFNDKDIFIHEWKKAEHAIKSCFVQDGALFINGTTGRIMAESYVVDIPTRYADQNGGLKHKNASAAGMKGCLAIKCSEDSCAIDGTGKGELEIFSGTKTHVEVPIPPKTTNPK